MTGHTPSTSEVRAAYILALRTAVESSEEHAAEFDRWWSSICKSKGVEQ